jgi:hypothetical protein
VSGSLAGSSATIAALIGADVLEEVFLQPHRTIGTIIPECAVEEHHSDRLQVTQHPIEIGANISDHAYMLPFEVTLRYGWSNALIGGQIQNLGDRFAAIGSESFQQVISGGQTAAIYEHLQQLQASRIPFRIVTGKRTYADMLITEMGVTTDARTENVLIVELHCQQIIRVSTSSTPAAAAQAMPEQTGDAINTGNQQLTPVPGGAVTGVA